MNYNKSDGEEKRRMGSGSGIRLLQLRENEIKNDGMKEE